MKIYEISYLPSLILDNTPITRLDKKHAQNEGAAYDTGQLNDVFHNGGWSKRKVIIWSIFREFDRKNQLDSSAN